MCYCSPKKSYLDYCGEDRCDPLSEAIDQAHERKMAKPKIRYSEQAKILLEHVTGIDMEDFEKWFLEESSQTIIGSATITNYLMDKRTKK